uniref:Uncharacterized protein n=1 Tax=Chromera velia CCMP2878 TaxID=1169474 RepID=A0A0G4GS67_9ALVE|eukprot:Cvel_23133.t1-p1 / transcript=Cvel_23133.t1 / gene=Cvel_23133 / organism=Chromera_velia_CCMP2878 / gene_product=hypothetical protein / transcript_product=hypothetical protein / location=Cvel_scaffold2351:5747-7217(-) / protein_length=247 / sequence_SO=supercontig / SO=protein_coding / is_pseudo=false
MNPNGGVSDKVADHSQLVELACCKPTNPSLQTLCPGREQILTDESFKDSLEQYKSKAAEMESRVATASERVLAPGPGEDPIVSYSRSLALDSVEIAKEIDQYDQKAAQANAKLQELSQADTEWGSLDPSDPRAQVLADAKDRWTHYKEYAEQKRDYLRAQQDYVQTYRSRNPAQPTTGEAYPGDDVASYMSGASKVDLSRLHAHVLEEKMPAIFAQAIEDINADPTNYPPKYFADSIEALSGDEDTQ